MLWYYVDRKDAAIKKPKIKMEIIDILVEKEDK